MGENSESFQGDASLWRQTILPSLSLFASAGTLLCCALPALLVTLGMGSVVAGLVGVAPWITIVSEHKKIAFTVAGVMLLLAAVVQWRIRNAPCPVDPRKAKACARLKTFSWVVLVSSVLVYLLGFFFAFLAVDIFFG